VTGVPLSASCQRAGGFPNSVNAARYSTVPPTSSVAEVGAGVGMGCCGLLPANWAIRARKSSRGSSCGAGEAKPPPGAYSAVPGPSSRTTTVLPSSRRRTPNLPIANELVCHSPCAFCTRNNTTSSPRKNCGAPKIHSTRSPTCPPGTRTVTVEPAVSPLRIAVAVTSTSVTIASEGRSREAI